MTQTTARFNSESATGKRNSKPAEDFLLVFFFIRVKALNGKGKVGMREQITVLDRIEHEFTYRTKVVDLEVINLTIGIECSCGHRWGLRTEDGFLKKGWWVCRRCGGHSRPEGTREEKE